MPLHGTVFSMEFNKSSMLSESRTSPGLKHEWDSIRPPGGCRDPEEGEEGWGHPEGKTSIY